MIRAIVFILALGVSAAFAARNTVTHYHKVKPGETLTSISAKYGISQANLKKINNLKGSSVRTGQRILVRKADRPTTEVSTRKRRRSSSRVTRSYDYYTVRKGDTLAEISTKTGISMRQLRSINRLKSSMVRAGQRLKVHTLTWVERPLDVDISPTPIMSCTEKTYHKVKEGDTLDSIAEQYNISGEQLKEANLLREGRLKTNQILVIPVLRDRPSSETEISEG